MTFNFSCFQSCCIQSFKVELIDAFYFFVVVIFKIRLENVVKNQYMTEDDLPKDFTNKQNLHNLEEIWIFPL